MRAPAGEATRRLRQFLAEQRTGSVTLNISGGRVCSVEFRERVDALTAGEASDIVLDMTVGGRVSS